MQIDETKMSVANAVLALVKGNAYDDDNENLTVYVEAFSNGREQGYSLTTFKRRVSFSENRNSDAIVVYFGKHCEFGADNMPSGNIWEVAKYFRYNQHYQAARFILKFLGGEKVRTNRKEV
jgi:hypothetical protein